MLSITAGRRHWNGGVLAAFLSAAIRWTALRRGSSEIPVLGDHEFPAALGGGQQPRECADGRSFDALSSQVVPGADAAWWCGRELFRFMLDREVAVAGRHG
jgi:hypothetical protein